MTGRFLGLYEGHTAIDTRPYPGVAATLARLAADGVALAVCTNKPERASRELLAALDLGRFFNAVVGGDSLDGVRKPDPRLVFAALTMLDAAPDASVMVGDNRNDVEAARAAGLRVIVRAGGYSRVPAADLGADAVIARFDELPAVLARLS
jgi:phosphoglycolate phosphatase